MRLVNLMFVTNMYNLFLNSNNYYYQVPLGELVNGIRLESGLAPVI